MFYEFASTVLTGQDLLNCDFFLLGYFCHSFVDPRALENVLFLSLGKDYAVSLLYPASVIKHLAVYCWLYLHSWDKLESQLLLDPAFFFNNLYCPYSSCPGCGETSNDLGVREAQVLSDEGRVGATWFPIKAGQWLCRSWGELSKFLLLLFVRNWGMANDDICLFLENKYKDKSHSGLCHSCYLILAKNKDKRV